MHVSQATEQAIGSLCRAAAGLLDQLRNGRSIAGNLEAVAVVEDKNSVEIAVNCKGEVSFRVKAYADTLVDAMLHAQNAAIDMRQYRDHVIAPTKKSASE